MTLKRIREYRGDPPFVASFRRTLGQLEERPVLDPDEAGERARRLLTDAFGEQAGDVGTGFAYGAADLMSHHTHYFDGFGLLKVMPQGTAVALRRSDGPASRVTFDGGGTWRFAAEDGAEPDEGPAWAGVFEETVRLMHPQGARLDVAVVSTVPPLCMDAYLTALVVATARALQSLFVQHNDVMALRAALARVLSLCVGRPFGVGGLVAAQNDEPLAFVLVDAATGEHLPLEGAPRDEVAWGLIDAGEDAVQSPAFYQNRQEQAAEALSFLQGHGFPELTSFRTLEHAQLQRALRVLPEPLQPVARHLVTENRRVQRMVVALRRQDWQLLGALLLMGHASLAGDWGGSTRAADRAVATAEDMTIEGMHGGRLVGRDRCVLVTGRAFVVPGCLDRIQADFEEHFGRLPDVMLL